MKIKQLELENFRGFAGKHIVKFHAEKPTVIVGVNGSGKTSVLDAVGILLNSNLVKVGRLKDEIKIDLRDTDVSLNHEKTSLRYNYCHSQKGLNKSYSIAYKQGSGFDNLPFLFDFNQLITNAVYGDGSDILPLLSYYQTNRLMSGEAIKSYSVDIGLLKKERLKIYKNAFASEIGYSEIVGWFIQQVNIENALKIEKNDITFETPSIKFLKEGVNNFFNLVDASISTLRVQKSSYTEGQVLILSKKNRQFELSQLSAGEKMLLGLVLDISYRMSIGNPRVANPLLISGVVLIDELELHLHPKWQATVLNALHQTFPNIQFIVTTHSPLVINHVKSDQLVLINNDKIIQGEEMQEVYGKDVNSIVENIMGAPKRPKDIEEMIEEIRNYLTDDNLQLDKAKEKLNKLQGKIGRNDSDVIELDTMILLEEDETY